MDLLQLQDDDVPTEINGYDLDDMLDVVDAVYNLWNETEFSLDVDRATGPVTLEYEIE